jgi:hypothetical protein
MRLSKSRDTQRAPNNSEMNVARVGYDEIKTAERVRSVAASPTKEC